MTSFLSLSLFFDMVVGSKFNSQWRVITNNWLGNRKKKSSFLLTEENKLTMTTPFIFALSSLIGWRCLSCEGAEISLRNLFTSSSAWFQNCCFQTCLCFFLPYNKQFLESRIKTSSSSTSLNPYTKGWLHEYYVFIRSNPK